MIGGDGNDYIDGGTGNDGMYGGTGDDTYFVDSAATSRSRRRARATTPSTPRSISPSPLAPRSNWCRRSTTMRASAIDITGNELANQLWGNNGVNTLSGGRRQRRADRLRRQTTRSPAAPATIISTAAPAATTSCSTRRSAPAMSITVSGFTAGTGQACPGREWRRAVRDPGFRRARGGLVRHRHRRAGRQ